MTPIEIYLEVGTKKVFAGALDWPGWCRHAKDEESALQALVDYGPRYAAVINKKSKLGFTPPGDVSGMKVVERLKGGATTDFGAPEMAPEADQKPVKAGELQRLLTIMDCCWKALEKAAEQAEGKVLRKGPRGGGRELEGMLEHVLDSQRGYLRLILWKNQRKAEGELLAQMVLVRQDVRDALTTAVENGLPEHGPRGGKLWVPRYFVRRSAWHIMDHVWEIEDRSEAG